MNKEYEKVIYSKVSIKKALRILPIHVETSEKNIQKMIQCDYMENGVISTELIPSSKICIVPVSKNDLRNSCVEKGAFYKVVLNEQYKEISRGEGISSVKLYLDDELFHKVISTFSKKNT